MMKGWITYLCIFFFIAFSTLPNLNFVLFPQSHDTQPDILILQAQPLAKDYVETARSSALEGVGTNIALLTSGPRPLHQQLPRCIELGEKCLFEDVGKFLEGTAPGIVHKPLQSIPSHRRIPYHMADNRTYIRGQSIIQPKNGPRTALVDYNHVLLPLYQNGENGTIVSNLHIELLDHLTGRYHPHFTEADADQVKYLAVSRISDVHICGPSVDPQRKIEPQNYVGFTLLDENLKPIKETDVAINLSLWILGRNTHDFQDFSVYSARTTKGSRYKDQLFLTASGQTYSHTFPFDIQRVPLVGSGSHTPNNASYSHFGNTWNTKVKGTPIPMNNDELAYGTGLQVRFMDDLRSEKRKGTYLFTKGAGLERGKNFHFFESTNGTTFLEVWPIKPHRTRPINFFASVFASYKNDVDYFPGSIRERRTITYPHKIIKGAKKEPWVSFASQKLDVPSPRGTACCVDMILNGNQQVKVGILHGKVQPRHYLSQFYAFLPDPPFDLVAITGWFCLGHMQEDDIDFASQWISRRIPSDRTAPTNIANYGNTTCPQVTFTSGITEMIGHDGENIIISYGVNDCYSRSLIVPKKKIEILLMGKDKSK